MQGTIALNDGRSMPQLGLGVWRMDDGETGGLVAQAVKIGWRSIDTAAIYGNERGVGEGIRACGLPREQLFVTTKLWNDRQGYDSALQAASRSLARLGLDCVDLYLIHWPAPAEGLFVETWKAFVRLREEGLARSIGVSNFSAPQIARLVEETGVTPAVNQIELHPRFQQAELRTFHSVHGIATECWSPLGQGRLLSEPAIVRIADKHQRSPAQVILRWHVELGLIAIPKTVSPARMRENLAVFDFALDEEDLVAFAALDSPSGRVGPDPARFP